MTEDPVHVQVEIDALCMELAQRLEWVPEQPAEPVNASRRNDVDLAARDGLRSLSRPGRFALLLASLVSSWTHSATTSQPMATGGVRERPTLVLTVWSVVETRQAFTRASHVSIGHRYH